MYGHHMLRIAATKKELLITLYSRFKAKHTHKWQWQMKVHKK
jgi:hypothetical protein